MIKKKIFKLMDFDFNGEISLIDYDGGFYELDT